MSLQHNRKRLAEIIDRDGDVDKHKNLASLINSSFCHTKLRPHNSFVIVAILSGSFFALASFSEYHHIVVAKQQHLYPWGGVNDNPWYYESPTVYAQYNLFSGILFLVSTSVMVWGVIKRRTIVEWTGIFLLGFLLLLNIISCKTLCCD